MTVLVQLLGHDRLTSVDTVVWGASQHSDLSYSPLDLIYPQDKSNAATAASFFYLAPCRDETLV